MCLRVYYFRRRRAPKAVRQRRWRIFWIVLGCLLVFAYILELFGVR